MFKQDYVSCLSVRPHGTTRLPLNGFFMKFELYVLTKVYYSPTNAQVIVLKTLLKFTLK